MPGVRLHHPTHRSTTFLVEDVTRPLRNGATCLFCSQQAGREVRHFVKTYHLDLDSNGDVIVAPPVLERLRMLPGTAGLKVLNEVAKPPDLTVGMAGGPQARFGNFSFVRHEFD